MRQFHCDHCGLLVFFENVECVKCGSVLAYLPDVHEIASLVSAGENTWSAQSPATTGKTYRLCKNYAQEKVCNWAVDNKDPNELCISCRLNRTIPNLSQPDARDAWRRLEMAKRRLVYTLLDLELPLANKVDDPQRGLAFDFLSDPDPAIGKAVRTGHDNGIITINIAEANDVEREKRRVSLFEPYRTLLGHFRHEVGHFYWDRLIANSDRLDLFRKQFGDERQDYAKALEVYYGKGAPPDWQTQFISAYSSAHPWEDWAESWAHYLHMFDALEIAAASGMSLRPKRADEPALKLDSNLNCGACDNFEQMIDNWFSLTYVLNNLNRGLGLPDGYPFVLSSPAIEKLQFIHETICIAMQSATSADLIWK